MSTKVAIGVIGLGPQGLHFLHQLDRRANIAAISDPDPIRLERAATRFPHAFASVNHIDVVDRARCEGVAIAVERGKRSAIALEALDAGLHCLVQAPHAMDQRAAELLAQRALESERATQVALGGLFHDRAARTRELLKGGVIGDLTDIHIWTDRHAVAPVQPSPFEDEPAWRTYYSTGDALVTEMATHLLALPFSAFEITAPSVLAVRRAVGGGTVVELAANCGSRLIRLSWHHGLVPDLQALAAPAAIGLSGTMVIGTRGRCYLPGSDNRISYFLPREEFGAMSPVDTGPALCHFNDWIDGCAGAPTVAPFFSFPRELAIAVALANDAIRQRR
jgi:predicted dehydrogenase